MADEQDGHLADPGWSNHEEEYLFVRNIKSDDWSDLANLYGVTTKSLNEQVKRNIKRFPEHFMFQLTNEEKEYVVANCDHLKKLKYSPFLTFCFYWTWDSNACQCFE